MIKAEISTIEEEFEILLRLLLAVIRYMIRTKVSLSENTKGWMVRK